MDDDGELRIARVNANDSIDNKRRLLIVTVVVERTLTESYV